MGHFRLFLTQCEHALAHPLQRHRPRRSQLHSHPRRRDRAQPYPPHIHPPGSGTPTSSSDCHIRNSPTHLFPRPNASSHKIDPARRQSTHPQEATMTTHLHLTTADLTPNLSPITARLTTNSDQNRTKPNKTEQENDRSAVHSSKFTPTAPKSSNQAEQPAPPGPLPHRHDDLDGLALIDVHSPGPDVGVGEGVDVTTG